MTTVNHSATPVIDKEERRLLFGVFLNVEEKLDIDRFRIKHEKALPIIDRLHERGFIVADGTLYRVTLDGLYALNNEATLEVIRTFNAILPVLASMYKEAGGSGKQWTVGEVLERAVPTLMMSEHQLARALWYVLPHVPIIGGREPGAPGELASFRLVEAVLNFPPLPLEKDLSPQPTPDKTAPLEKTDMAKDPRTVFVVHGRNERARVAVFGFLRSVGLHPLEWEEARNLTGKTSPYVGEILDAAFAHAQAIVVVLTGDDEARLREELRRRSDPAHEVDLTPQARANVLFEAGMALGRHDDRTVVLELGPLRPFSDITGRHTVRLETGNGRERQTIVARLRSAGCHVETEARGDWLEQPFFRGVLPSAPRATRVAGAARALRSRAASPVKRRRK